MTCNNHFLIFLWYCEIYCFVLLMHIPFTGHLLDIPYIKFYILYYFEFKTYSTFKEGFKKKKGC